MAQAPRYGIGEQDFKSLRERNCIYVDKTGFIEKIIESGSKYYFLARPRRFGKSLFLSTMKYFFEGRRELFRDLYIDSTSWNWEPYPVLRLDLNRDKYSEKGLLDSVLNSVFRHWEAEYDVPFIADDLSSRFGNIIKTAHEKTGRQVVILVDEYDKPLVGNLDRNENFEHYREKLAAIYSNFKSSAEHIRLVFLTGVSRFSKLSVFSDLNNLSDITFDDSYANICGITESELHENFKEGISKLAEAEDIEYDEALLALKRNYDGYRFAKTGSDMYNPWSVLNCLERSEIANYWNRTGLPTLLAKSFKRLNVDLEETLNVYCSAEDLQGMDLLNPDPTALMYQTGYLTIKDYNRKIRRYRLGIPNNEVKDGFFHCLVPQYVSTKMKQSDSVIDSSSTGNAIL